MNKISSRGALVKAVIKERGFSSLFVAKKLQIHRITLKNWLDQEDLDFVKIQRIGDIINYNFDINFPEMKTEMPWLSSSAKDKLINELEEKIKFWTNETYQAKSTIKQLEKKISYLENLMQQNNQNIAADPPENYKKLNP